MVNAYLPDEKRRHQYLPTEEPPDYNTAEQSISSSSRPRRDRRRHPTRDDVDNLQESSDDEHDGYIEPHRPASEDSSLHEMEEMELDEPATKQPIHIRISRELHRITARVDEVLYTYVNPTIMRYVYGSLLGIIVVSAVYFFGASVPTLEIPKSYAEDALRTYITEELSASNIRAFTNDASKQLHAHDIENIFDNRKLADWIHTEFSKLGVARNALDTYTVYFPAPEVDSMRLVMDDVQPTLFNDKYLRTFVAHGSSGNVTAPLVFANFAAPQDFAWLKTQGIIVDGAVVVMKRSNVSDLATQISIAQTAGAVGCIVYNSAEQGSSYPEGPFIATNTARSGDAAFSWIQPGDVLTPGYSASDKVKTVEPQDSAALPRIPTMSISNDDAGKLLAKLDNVGKSNSDWTSGVSSLTKVFTGDGSTSALQLQMTNLQTDDRKHTIRNVLSEIEGVESDQVLVIGTSMASMSNIGVILEVSRIYADLVTKYKWRPRRSIIFALWDSTDQNYMGSVEWGEGQIKSLRRQGIAYINLENVVSLSSDLYVRATPSLAYSLLTAMEYVKQNGENKSVAFAYGEHDVPDPSGFSDSVVFNTHIGMATADIGLPASSFSRDCLNSASCINEHIDPDFHNHAMMGKYLSMIILELVDERFIQLDLHHLARHIEESLRKLSYKYPSLDMGGDFRKVLQELDSKTDITMQFLNEWAVALQENKQVESQAMNLRRSNWNYAVTRFHRNLLRSVGWTTWFANPMYGPSQHVNDDGSRTWLFPHIEDYMAQGKVDKAQGALQMLGETLLAACEALSY